MTLVNVTEAKAQLSALLEEVSRGAEVIVSKAGKPVARIVPYKGLTEPRKPGSMKGEIWMAPDFKSLPQDMEEAFFMREPKA